MALKVRDWIVTNWPIKLTAIALATILWAVTAAQEPDTRIVNVQLEIQPPEGREVTQAPPLVQARYAGAARELFKLTGQPPIIQRTLPDTVAGSSYTLEISPADLFLSDDIDATPLDVQPRMITIQLDQLAQRTVPVIPRVTVQTDSGFAQFGDVAVSPESIVIRGPDAEVRGITSVNTVPLDLTELTAPVQRQLAIDTSRFGVVRLSHHEVEISVDVGAVAERVLLGVPVTINSAQGGQWESDPPGVTVTVSGASARLARLGRDSVEVLVHVTGEQGLATAAVEVMAPEGIRAWAVPDSVVVRRTRRD